MNVLSQSAPLHGWLEFYSLLGTGSATMVGLLFVAASVGAGVFTSGRRAALRVFLSASVVNFSLTFAVSLLVLAPITDQRWLAGLVFACGLFGLAHSGLSWRDTCHDGLIAQIDLEDRIWYIALPIVGYLCVAAAGALLGLRLPAGGPALAAATGLLLAIGIHNAWDITLWIITRQRT